MSLFYTFIHQNLYTTVVLFVFVLHPHSPKSLYYRSFVCLCFTPSFTKISILPLFCLSLFYTFIHQNLYTTVVLFVFVLHLHSPKSLYYRCFVCLCFTPSFTKISILPLFCLSLFYTFIHQNLYTTVVLFVFVLHLHSPKSLYYRCFVCLCFTPSFTKISILPLFCLSLFYTFIHQNLYTTVVLFVFVLHLHSPKSLYYRSFVCLCFTPSFTKISILPLFCLSLFYTFIHQNLYTTVVLFVFVLHLHSPKSLYYRSFVCLCFTPSFTKISILP